MPLNISLIVLCSHGSSASPTPPPPPALRPAAQSVSGARRRRLSVPAEGLTAGGAERSPAGPQLLSGAFASLPLGADCGLCGATCGF